MPAPILYCGDTSLSSAAAYLAGVLTASGEAFDYIPSDRPWPEDALQTPRPLVILSDYPAANVSEPARQRLVQHTHDGGGLLMIGGWESYHGAGGDWDATAVGGILPVAVSHEDDRINWDQPALVRCVGDHPATRGLPWDSRPPVVGGFNRVAARANSEVLLEVDRCRAQQEGNGWRLSVEESHPLLVVGAFGAGRTAALATDVAPHWVGGLVDWGTGRVSARAAGAEPVEVGDLYAAFFQQLISWTKRQGS